MRSTPKHSHVRRTEAGFEPIIGNPGDGASPSCSIVDEYHEHDSAALYETMLTGMGARRHPLMFIITTSGANIEGPCYDKRREVIEMLEGLVPNDELFGWIWTLDEGDDWTDPKVLAKANPNMGVSVYADYLVSQQQRAIKQARFTNTFKTKHLNLWVTAKAGFFNLQQWEACKDESLVLEQFEGQNCILGFDLARKLDMNSMARVFYRDIDGKRHYYSVAPDSGSRRTRPTILRTGEWLSGSRSGSTLGTSTRRMGRKSTIERSMPKPLMRTGLMLSSSRR